MGHVPQKKKESGQYMYKVFYFGEPDLINLLFTNISLIYFFLHRKCNMNNYFKYYNRKSM